MIRAAYQEGSSSSREGAREEPARSTDDAAALDLHLGLAVEWIQGRVFKYGMLHVVATTSIVELEGSDALSTVFGHDAAHERGAFVRHV